MKQFVRRLRASFRTRSWRAGAYSVFAAVLVVAMGAVAVLAVSALPASMNQWDMTKNGLYSISEGTQQVLAGLDRDVTIYWLVQEDHENVTVQQMLYKYAQYDHVTVTEVDPVRYPGFAAGYTDEEITDNSLLAVCGERSLYIPYADVWTYSDYEQYAYYLNNYGEEYLDVFTGEEKLTSAVLYVTSDVQPVMYYLTGHGETGVSESVLNALAMQNISTRSLNLLTEKAVPADCDVLALFGAVSDLTDREAEMVRAYLKDGGQLLLTTAYTPAGETPNLEALLADFGLDLVGGYVMESDSRYYNYGYIDLILPTLGQHAITAPLTAGEGHAVIMPDAQALTDASGEAGPASVTALLTSSSTSYVKLDVEGADNYDRRDGDPEGPFILAAASERSDTGARLVVFGSTRFMEADFSDMVSGTNLDLFLNGADWLCRQEQSISIHPKTLTGEYLSFTDSAANALKVALTVVVPVLFLAAGVCIFVRRRRR